MRRLSKVTVMRRHSVAMAFLSDASETRPEAACRLSNRDSHPNTSFSSGRGWRGPCFARTVTTVTICCKLWLCCRTRQLTFVLQNPDPIRRHSYLVPGELADSVKERDRDIHNCPNYCGCQDLGKRLTPLDSDRINCC